MTQMHPTDVAFLKKQVQEQTMSTRFGDYFHEIPEPEIFPLPCGGSVSSECVINSLGQTYTIEVIPRQVMIKALTGRSPHPDVALGFRIVEEAGTGRAWIYTEKSDHLGGRLLAQIYASSLPEMRQAA